MEQKADQSFGKWRSRFLPIFSHEWGKVLPMAFMFFLISLNYNALRVYKDTFVVTARHSGAEAIPFIKTWVVVPCAILCTLLYTRLVNRFSREVVFYIILSIFLVFFFLFAFVFYPAQESFHPNLLADRLTEVLPPGCRGLVAAFRNWTFTLFYVFSELWSTMIFTVLFWGFVNEITSVHDARRFYGFIMTAGNIAGIFSGQLAIIFSQNHFHSWIPYGETAWDQSIFLLTCLLLTSGVLIIALFRWLNRSMQRADISAGKGEPKEAKVRMSMRESFKYLLRSRYLAYIAIIVLGYNIAINLVEVVWKNQIKQLYPDPSMYNIIMGKVMVITSILATVAGFFATSGVVRRYPWTFAAMIPPIILGGSGILFFFFACMEKNEFYWISWFSMTPLFFSFVLGAIQNCLSRAIKYTIFDTTKEIAFIPLDKESKLKGKAAIDGIGSRLGKSAGSVIHQSFFLLFASFTASTPYIALVFVVVVVLWSFAVLSLGKQFDQLVTTKRKGPVITGELAKDHGA